MKNLFSYERFEEGEYKLPYRFHKPENFEEGKKYPVVLFLHGAGERGDDAEIVLAIGILTALSDPESPLHDAYIICPQCPFEKQWVDTPWDKGSYDSDVVAETVYLNSADKLCDYIVENYPIDEKKRFVSGISMGGYGSWDILARHGEKYTGGFICCGSGVPTKAEKMKDKIIYTYHGALDDVVPCKGTREMVAALEAVGGNIHYTEFPDLYHGCWDAAYSCFEDIKELFSHELA